MITIHYARKPQAEAEGVKLERPISLPTCQKKSHNIMTKCTKKPRNRKNHKKMSKNFNFSLDKPCPECYYGTKLMVERYFHAQKHIIMCLHIIMCSVMFRNPKTISLHYLYIKHIIHGFPCEGSCHECETQ